MNIIKRDTDILLDASEQIGLEDKTEQYICVLYLIVRMQDKVVTDNNNVS